MRGPDPPAGEPPTEAGTLEALRDTPVRAPEVLWLDAGGAVGDEAAPSDLVDTARVVAALLDHAEDVAAEPPVLSHGDFHVGNVLFDGARVTGIVDWPHARIADPRADVASCALDLALLAGPAAGRALLDEHAALRGAMADEAWWRLRAATSALPDPVAWLPPWQVLGADVTADQVRARFVDWVDEALGELTG